MEYRKIRQKSMHNKAKIAEEYSAILIYLDMEGSTKEEVFMNMALFAKEKGLIHDEISIYRKFIDYEKAKGTTAVDCGIACPEACGIEISRPFAFILCRIKNPIDFDPLDGKSVRILLVSLIRDKAAPGLLKAMTRIAGLLRKEDFRTAFLKAENEKEASLLLKDSEKWKQ